MDDLVFVPFNSGVITILTDKLNTVRTITVPSPICAFEGLYYEKQSSYKGFVVALENKQLRMYGPKGNTLINSVQLDDECTALKFGKIVRENGCLVLMFKNIGIQIKMLKKDFLDDVSPKRFLSKLGPWCDPAG